MISFLLTSFELRFSLFEECGDAFLEVFAGRAFADEACFLLGVVFKTLIEADVHELLDILVSKERSFGQFLGKGMDGFIQLLLWNDFFDKADSKSFVCLDLTAGNEEVEGAVGADDSREEHHQSR